MIVLCRPRMDLYPSYLDFICEMQKDGEKIWDGMLPRQRESPEEFVERLLSSEQLAEPGFVTETKYWAVQGDFVVGRIALRHRLDDKLAEFGGHIGYEVRPSCRRQGIAREMLRLLLQTPKARSIGRFLLTCAPDNVASNKTIQANGGVLVKTAFSKIPQRMTNYYQIDLMGKK